MDNNQNFYNEETLNNIILLKEQNLSGTAGVAQTLSVRRDNWVDSESDPTSSLGNLVDGKNMGQMMHNNMVPFYKRLTQNMKGTGVPSGNTVDGIVPSFKMVESEADTNSPYHTQLSTFTGVDDTYLHKKETGPFFSPAEQQTGFGAGGMPLSRPDLDKYKMSLSKYRNDLAPIEAVKVGKGLSLSPDVPASGGFHEYTRVLPNNIFNYKVNQLPGEVVTGKYYSAGLPTSYPGIGTTKDKESPGITKNRPERVWNQEKYPTMATVSNIKKDLMRPDFGNSFRPKTDLRGQTTYGLSAIKVTESFTDSPESCMDISIGTGPKQSHVSLGQARSEIWMSMDNNIRSRSDCNTMPNGNAHRQGMLSGAILSNWQVNETDRGTVNPQNVMQLNLSAPNKATTFYTYQDSPDTTIKETTQFTYSGNSARPGEGSTFYTFKDTAKTTTKETTQFTYAGNSLDTSKGTLIYTYEDLPDTTIKETTQFSHSGNPGIGSFGTSDRSMFMGVE